MGKAEVQAVDEIYRVARQQADEKITSLEQEIEAVREESLVLGVIRKIDHDLAYNQMLKYVALHRIKQAKDYRKGGLNWEGFCEAIGEDRRNVDRILGDIRPLIDAFSDKLSVLVGMSFSKIRLLGKSVSGKMSGITEEGLLIGEERIPLDEDHKEDLQAALERLLEAKDQLVDEKEKALQTEKRLVQAKEDLIKRQVKDLSRYEREAEAKGLTPAEDAFIQKCDNARLTIDGFLNQFDPSINPLPEDATPRMKATLMHTLAWFKRCIIASFDTANDVYGEPEMDDTWVPFHLRVKEEAAPELPEGMGCSGCDYHKGMINSAKGIKTPGISGKCTRPEGLCNPSQSSQGKEGE